MASLIISDPFLVKEAFDDKICSYSYEQFNASRRSIQYDKTEQDKHLQGKVDFKKRVIDIMFNLSKIKIGEYYVFKVSELQALINLSPEADYVHFYNCLDSTDSNMMYAFPVNSKNEINNRNVINGTSLVLSGFPCPPDPRCPKFILM